MNESIFVLLSTLIVTLGMLKLLQDWLDSLVDRHLAKQSVRESK